MSMVGMDGSLWMIQAILRDVLNISGLEISTISFTERGAKKKGEE